MIIFQGEPHHDLVRDVRQNKGSILKVGKAVTGRYMLDLTTCNLALGKCRVHKETKEGDSREESLRREVSNSGCCFFLRCHFQWAILGSAFLLFFIMRLLVAMGFINCPTQEFQNRKLLIKLQVIDELSPF